MIFEEFGSFMVFCTMVKIKTHVTPCTCILKIRDALPREKQSLHLQSWILFSGTDFKTKVSKLLAFTLCLFETLYVHTVEIIINLK